MTKVIVLNENVMYLWLIINTQRHDTDYMVRIYDWVNSAILRLCGEEGKAVMVQAGSIPAPLQCHKAEH